VDESARSLAIFIDFENLALGFQGRERFDMTRVLERLVEKGKIVAKKAYADWSRFANYTFMLHNAAIELVEIPRRALTGKNSADIRLCVDAMDLAYSKEHIDTFVVVSGDSDFSPLVSKLKELGKHVIGLGMIKSTSDLLRDNCDEFIYYEDLGKTQELGPQIDPQIPEGKRKAFSLLIDALVALRRDNQGNLGSSMIKDTIKRKKPSFNESYHGYRSFSDLLLDAQKLGLVELDVDKRSRTYVVSRFGAELSLPKPEVRSSREQADDESDLPVLGQRRRRRRRGRGNGNGHTSREGTGTSEAGRVRMSVPLPASTPQPTPAVPPVEEEDEEDFDVLEESDPRLARLEELDDEEEEDEDEDEDEESLPSQQGRPQQQRPTPRPEQRPPQQQQKPQQQKARQPQQKPQPQQRPAQKQPVRPVTPQPQQPARPVQQQPQRQPQSRPQPAQPVITEEDADLFFSTEEQPVRPAPVKPQPQPRIEQLTPRPRSQPVPRPVEEPAEEATEERSSEEHAETTEGTTEPAEVAHKTPTKKPARKRAPSTRSRGGQGRGKKKPTDPPASV
jgi:uncharacterized protein (TIGR00288 family)